MTDELDRLIKSAGWPIDMQLVWLRQRKFDSWEKADQETVNEAIKMLRDTCEMFSATEKPRIFPVVHNEAFDSD